MQLQGRRIIVTGGARGIGAATVRAYAAEGASVVSIDVLDDEGRDVAEKATVEGPGSVRYLHCDVSSREQVDATFDTAVAELGGLDVLAAIAGVERGGPAEEVDEETFDFIFRINVLGTILLNQAAHRHMKDTGGNIINVGSDAGLAGYRGLSLYGASKGAVMAWTRNAALEWGPLGIAVNSLVPAIWTPMYQEHRDRMTPDELASHDAVMGRNIVMGGRLGDPERDLRPTMVFLATEGSRFITGQLVNVNGGVGMSR